MNHAFYSRAELRIALETRLSGFPGGALLARLALSEQWYERVLRGLARIDFPQERPYSFGARCPG